MADEAWRAGAACGDKPTALFFSPAVAEAKAVCAGCPVRQECLTYAMKTRQEDGVWGGLDEAERRRLRRRRFAGTRPSRTPTTNDCGTPNKYRRGGCRCEACTAAAAEACRISKARSNGREVEPCPECGRVYASARLWQHLAIAHDQRSTAVCPECGETVRPRGMARHEAAHRNAPNAAAQRKRAERARAREEAS